jgi:hypothetical protein
MLKILSSLEAAGESSAKLISFGLEMMAQKSHFSM